MARRPDVRSKSSRRCWRSRPLDLLWLDGASGSPQVHVRMATRLTSSPFGCWTSGHALLLGLPLHLASLPSASPWSLGCAVSTPNPPFRHSFVPLSVVHLLHSFSGFSSLYSSHPGHRLYPSFEQVAHPAPISDHEDIHDGRPAERSRQLRIGRDGIHPRSAKRSRSTHLRWAVSARTGRGPVYGGLPVRQGHVHHQRL